MSKSLENYVGKNTLDDDNSKPWGYWRDWKNLENALKEIIRDNGYFLSGKELEEIGRSDISNAIRKHGGMREVRKRLGFEPKVQESGFYNSWKNVKAELEEISRGLGHFPSSKELREKGKSTLSAVICAKYGGFFSVRKKLGYKPSRTKDNYFKSFKNVKEEIERVIKITGDFPNQKEMRKHSPPSLVSALYKHHGGIYDTRERMGYANDETTRNYWRDWENVRVELENLIEELGHFPTHSELRIDKRTSLSRAILIHGGTKAVREKLGYAESRKGPNYWKEWENVEAELKAIAEKNQGIIPPLHKVRMGYGGLLKAITKYFGGINAVRERMGYSRENEPSILEDYVGGEDE